MNIAEPLSGRDALRALTWAEHDLAQQQALSPSAIITRLTQSAWHPARPPGWRACG